MRYNNPDKIYFKPDKKKIDEIKFELCDAIDRLAAREQWTQRQTAAYLSTSTANVNRVLRKKLDKVSLSQLFAYLTILKPNFKFLISI